MYFDMHHRDMHHSTRGIVVYGPKRGVDRNGKPIIDENRVTIQIRDGFGICDYYSHQFFKKFGLQLVRPSWEPHVTVIGDRRYNGRKAPWGYRTGDVVNLEYSHYMFWNDEHVWLAAECPALLDIQRHYNHHRYDRGHLTIGKFHVDDVGKIPQFKRFEDIKLWDDYIWNTPIF